MNDTRNHLARKYAQAYLNLYAHQLNDDYFSNLDSLRLFLQTNGWLYHYLSIKNVEYSVKQDVIQRIAEIIGCTDYTTLLINTLLKSGRIDLLDTVIQKILEFYHLQQNIEKFTILTSHPLSDDEKEQVLTFIRHLTKKTITATFSVDESLICGIRVQSGQSFFERSIAHQLKDFEQSLLRRVSL